MAAQGSGGKGDHYVSESGAKLNKGVCESSNGRSPPCPSLATSVEIVYLSLVSELSRCWVFLALQTRMAAGGTLFSGEVSAIHSAVE